MGNYIQIAELTIPFLLLLEDCEKMNTTWMEDIDIEIMKLFKHYYVTQLLVQR